MGGSGAAPAPYPPIAFVMPVAPRPAVSDRSRDSAPLFQDRLELELAADRGVGLHDLETRHRVVVDVAVGVEAPLAVDALEVLGGGHRLAERLALLGRILALLDRGGRPLDRVDRDPARFRRIEGVGGGLLPELL